MTAPPYLKKSQSGVYLKIKVAAKSSRNAIVGVAGDRIKVAVRAAPQNGEANEAVVEVLAEFFEVKKSRCVITTGHTSSLKTVFIEGDVFVENLEF
ncbi:MAG: DUF167 domain-containing protein [Holosporaceae bacterium]|nr:DUF167 domain-containing protein [Holosporaceae bacterium]